MCAICSPARSCTAITCQSLGALDGPWYYANPRRLSARLFKTVTTGPGVLHELTAPADRWKTTRRRAQHRLTGSLFGEDGQQTCLVITLTEAAKRDLRRALGRGILGKPRGELLVLAEEAGIQRAARSAARPAGDQLDAARAAGACTARDQAGWSSGRQRRDRRRRSDHARPPGGALGAGRRRSCPGSASTASR